MPYEPHCAYDFYAEFGYVSGLGPMNSSALKVWLSLGAQPPEFSDITCPYYIDAGDTEQKIQVKSYMLGQWHMLQDMGRLEIMSDSDKSESKLMNQFKQNKMNTIKSRVLFDKERLLEWAEKGNIPAEIISSTDFVYSEAPALQVKSYLLGQAHILNDYKAEFSLRAGLTRGVERAGYYVGIRNEHKNVFDGVNERVEKYRAEFTQNWTVDDMYGKGTSAYRDHMANKMRQEAQENIKPA